MILLLPFAHRTAERGYGLCQGLPTNRLVRYVRTRRGLRWGIPLALLGVLYAVGAVVCATIVQQGGSEWWNLGFLLGFWNALKLIGNGICATILLSLVRIRERYSLHRSVHVDEVSDLVAPRGR